MAANREAAGHRIQKGMNACIQLVLPVSTFKFNLRDQLMDCSAHLQSSSFQLKLSRNTIVSSR